MPLLFDSQIKKPNNNRILKVIVVDDDQNLLNLTSEVLKQNNFEVFSFTDANAALEIAKKQDFDFVITDIQMPEIDGFEFLEKLKNLSEYKNQPVFALTGRTDLELETYQNLGFCKVIAKPYLPKNLIQTIHNLSNSTNINVILSDEISVQDSTVNYSLSAINQFLPNNKNALNEFIGLLIKTTKTNLQDFDAALANNNLEVTKAISHRMNPVFKQIHAHQIATILDELETKSLSFEEIEENIEVLKTKIDSLFSELHQLV